MTQKLLWRRSCYGAETFMAQKPLWRSSLYGAEAFMVQKPLWRRSLYGAVASMAQKAFFGAEAFYGTVELLWLGSLFGGVVCIGGRKSLAVMSVLQSPFWAECGG